MKMAVREPSGIPSHQWLADLAGCLEQGQPQILITVVRTQGSTPRDTGARMWVGSDFIVDTIGGGHLEWKAIAHARALLKEGRSRCTVKRYPLGPELGQCCGGVVWLMFECLSQDDAQWCKQIVATLSQGRGMQRLVVFDFASTENDVTKEAFETGVSCDVAERICYPLDTSATHFTHVDMGAGKVSDIWNGPRAHIVVCGAGHIGYAIIKLLAELPVRVIWLDPREDCWPSSVPGNVQILQGDETDVPDMPDHAYWLVLTHNHALDLAIIDAIFRHQSFEFLGLIGSKTKKARFVSRLSKRHAPELVDRICCPIGIVQTSSKLPAVIAVSVVAQLVELIGA